MTNKTTMPDPVERVVLRDDGPHLVYEHQVFSTDKRLITTDQAEAYKDACVREALEEAAGLADREHFGGQHDDDLGWTSCAAHTSDAIRALIPTTK